MTVRANKPAFGGFLPQLFDRAGQSAERESERFLRRIQVVKLQCTCVPAIAAHDAATARLVDEGLLHATTARTHGFRPALGAACSVTIGHERDRAMADAAPPIHP